MTTKEVRPRPAEFSAGPLKFTMKKACLP